MYVLLFTLCWRLEGEGRRGEGERVKYLALRLDPDVLYITANLSCFHPASAWSPSSFPLAPRSASLLHSSSSPAISHATRNPRPSLKRKKSQKEKTRSSNSTSGNSTLFFAFCTLNTLHYTALHYTHCRFEDASCWQSHDEMGPAGPRGHPHSAVPAHQARRGRDLQDHGRAQGQGVHLYRERLAVKSPTC